MIDKMRKRVPEITTKEHSSTPGKLDKIKIGKKLLSRKPKILKEAKDFRERKNAIRRMDGKGNTK